MAYMEYCTSIACEFVSQNQKNLLPNKTYIHTTCIHKSCVIYSKDQLTLQTRKLKNRFLFILSTFGTFQHQCKIDVKIYRKRS